MGASRRGSKRESLPPRLPGRLWAFGVGAALMTAHMVAAQDAAATSIVGGNGTWVNWEGTVSCHPQTLATPTTYEEVARLVAGHARVRSAGLGHSFNTFVCSRDLMVSTTGLNKVLGLDPRAMTVTTQAGVKTRDLMTWLGDRGYALPTYSYYIDQTIAGAISTNSHGSSMRYGTMSSFVRAAKLVLANGTIATIDASRPEHLAAVRSNVGLLGVVVELTLDVIKNTMAYRNSTLLDQSVVLADMDRALADPMAVDGLQYCYFPMLRTVMRSEVKPSSWATRLITQLRGGGGARTNDGTFDLPEANSRAYWTVVHPFPLSNTIYLTFVRFFTDNPSIEINQLGTVASAYLFMAYSGFYPVGKAMPTQPEVYTETLLRTLKIYDQYEWAVPFSHMKDCVQGLFQLAERNPAFRSSNRSPLLFRFVRAEPDVLLSLTHDGPRFFINIDNYHAYKEHPEAFDEIKQHLSGPRCLGRLHLGKTSLRSAPGLDWKPEDVAEAKAQYGGNWARFQRVAQELDPTGKFSDPQNLWRAS